MRDVDRRIAMERDLLNWKLREQEEQASEHLCVIRAAKEQWDSYGQLMSLHARRVEEASTHENAENYFAQRRLAARRELDTYVGRLVREQEELLEEAEREITSRVETEPGPASSEEGGAPWD